jgi:steroid delta-isomerase
MTTPDDMRATLERYLEMVGRGDVDGVVALFADSISVEDPVGGGPGTHVVGRANVEAFFRKGFERSRPAPKSTGAIRTTAGNEAAVPFVLRLTLRGRCYDVDVVDVVTFDDEGKITSLRAFWNAAEMRPVD